jgi:redox-sensitive bicupin YhaK (pirin superfamily)
MNPASRPVPAPAERIISRVADVGAATVRRALPARGRRTIGAWCLLDHFGPGAPMAIGPQPHVGIQTVTRLVEGEVVHRDSLGSRQPVRPGQLNLMTAGRGVAHAEESPPGRDDGQHGVQLWIALPDATRDGEPAFEHRADLPVVELGALVVTVLNGALAGVRSGARADTPIVGAGLSAPDGGDARLTVDPDFEHGLVAFDGTLDIEGESVAPGELLYLGPGRDRLEIGARAGSHGLLIGGEPFGAPPRMWWNFVARTDAEIDQARSDWEAGSARFGTVDSQLARIPAPSRAGGIRR